MLDHGQFRNVFRILGTPYVLKVPRSSFKVDVDHSVIEINSLRLLRRKVYHPGTPFLRYEPLRPFLPTFYYANRNTGVILTDLYSPVPYGGGKFKNKIKEIHEWLEDNGFAEADLEIDKTDNYGQKNGKLVILDLGCFEAKGGWC